jgi:hypothetical protein
MCHAGLVNNSLVTDYDIGVLPSEYQDYLKSMVGVQHDKTLKINTHNWIIFNISKAIISILLIKWRGKKSPLP